MALHELHAVSDRGMKELINQAVKAGMSPGAIYDMVEEAVEYDEELARALIRMGGMTIPPATRRQAKAVVQTARRVGLDDHQLADIAAALRRYDLQKLGINVPTLAPGRARQVMNAARKAGFPEAAIAGMRDAVTE